METLVRNIQLNFTDSVKKLTVGNLDLSKNYIRLSEESRFKNRGCLFTKKHNLTQTKFDLTGANNCELLCFDEHLNFVSIRHYKNHQNAPVIYLIPEAYVLMLPVAHELPVVKTQYMKLLEYPIIPGVRHVYGTDAEKVEILANNTHRFYMSEYGVWQFPGQGRISILQDLLKRAKKRGNHALCNRITEVIGELNKLPEYKKKG